MAARTFSRCAAERLGSTRTSGPIAITKSAASASPLGPASWITGSSGVSETALNPAPSNIRCTRAGSAQEKGPGSSGPGVGIGGSKCRTAGGGMNIVDDRRGCRPAGTERWLKDGFLNAERMLPLSIVERQACYYVFSEPAAICQNMFLATEALGGLGGWKHCGFLSLEILQRIGFRIVAANGGAAFGNPIGLDGVFEASCPPYHATMDAAVDAVLAPPSL